MFTLYGIICDLACDFRFNQQNAGYATTLPIVDSQSVSLVSGGSIDVSGWSDANRAGGIVIPIQIAAGAGAGTNNYGYARVAFVDIRPTTVVPLDLALTDTAIEGELTFTISNAASYVDTDEIEIRDSSSGVVYARTSVALYNTLGYGRIAGLTKNVAVTVVAYATSDLNTYSDASATATGTPTFDEAARNTDPGEALVADGTAYKIQNVDKTGELAAGITAGAISKWTITGNSIEIWGYNFGSTTVSAYVKFKGVTWVIDTWTATYIKAKRA